MRFKRVQIVEASDTMLPCPRCGTGDMLKVTGSAMWWVVCENCWAEGPTGSTKEEAINSWNDRWENERA